MTPLIEVMGAQKRYGHVTALADVGLQADGGSVIGLIGENGCGKSTLLKAIAGLVRLDAGSIRVCGQPVGVESKAALAYLPDRSALPGGAMISECMATYERFFPDFDPSRARDILAGFGLAQSRGMRQMSKGQQEKAQVALTMARRASVYLLDEPISGVDPLAREATLRAVIEALSPESLLIITTHMVQDVEMIVDRALIMRRGQILDDVNPEATREETGEGLLARMRTVYAR